MHVFWIRDKGLQMLYLAIIGNSLDFNFWIHLLQPDPGSHYTAWSSMSTLTRKGYIIKTNNPARYKGIIRVVSSTSLFQYFVYCKNIFKLKWFQISTFATWSFDMPNATRGWCAVSLPKYKLWTAIKFFVPRQFRIGVCCKGSFKCKRCL